MLRHDGRGGGHGVVLADHVPAPDGLTDVGRRVLAPLARTARAVRTIRAILLQARGGLPAAGFLDGALDVLARGVAHEVAQGRVRLAVVGGRGRPHARTFQRVRTGRRARTGLGADGRPVEVLGGRVGGPQGELAAALQGAGTLGLGGGVAAQQVGVFGAQPGQLGALGAELGVEGGAHLARFLGLVLQLGYALVGLPLLTGEGGGELGDPLAGAPVPVAHEERADDRGGPGRGGQRADHQCFAHHP